MSWDISFTVTASSKPGTNYPARGREGRAHTCVCRVTPVHWHVGSKCTGKHAEGAELSQGTEQEMSRQTGANSQPQPHAGTEVRSTRHQTHRGTLHGPRDTSPHLAHAGGALRPRHWATGRSRPLPRHPPRPPPSKNSISLLFSKLTQPFLRMKAHTPGWAAAAALWGSRGRGDVLSWGTPGGTEARREGGFPTETQPQHPGPES